MARERMGIYADIGTFEAFAKLGVCYLLSAIPVYYLDNTISDSTDQIGIDCGYSCFVFIYILG